MDQHVYLYYLILIWMMTDDLTIWLTKLKNSFTYQITNHDPNENAINRHLSTMINTIKLWDNKTLETLSNGFIIQNCMVYLIIMNPFNLETYTNQYFLNIPQDHYFLLDIFWMTLIFLLVHWMWTQFPFLLM